MEKLKNFLDECEKIFRDVLSLLLLSIVSLAMTLLLILIVIILILKNSFNIILKFIENCYRKVKKYEE